MRLFLLFFCLGVFVINARAEEQATEQQQTKSIGEGAEQQEMTKEERKAMRSEKRKAHKEMKKAMREAKEKHKKAVKKIHEDHKAAAKKVSEPPPVPTEEQIKKADAEEDSPAGDDQD